MPVSLQITKCSLDDLLISVKANKMALNSAVYMEDVDGKHGKCSLSEVFPIIHQGSTSNIILSF